MRWSGEASDPPQPQALLDTAILCAGVVPIVAVLG